MNMNASMKVPVTGESTRKMEAAEISIDAEVIMFITTLNAQ
jgi:hypothetical protein